MRGFRRFVAGLGGVIAVVAFVASLVGGIGVWVVKEPTRQKIDGIYHRVDAALVLADEGLDQVGRSLTAAGERLQNVKEEQQRVAREPQTGGAARRIMARTIQQQLAPEIRNAHDKLNAVAEAAVVVNAILEDAGNLPLFSKFGLDPGDMAQLNGSLSQVEASAWELSRLFSDSSSQQDADSASAEISRLENTLARIQALIGKYDVQIDSAKQRCTAMYATTMKWFTPATVIISLACLWIALSQISVLAHVRAWWRG